MSYCLPYPPGPCIFAQQTSVEARPAGHGGKQKNNVGILRSSTHRHGHSPAKSQQQKGGIRKQGPWQSLCKSCLIHRPRLFVQDPSQPRVGPVSRESELACLGGLNTHQDPTPNLGHLISSAGKGRNAKVLATTIRHAAMQLCLIRPVEQLDHLLSKTSPPNQP